MEKKTKRIHRDRIVDYLERNPYATVLEMSTRLRITNVPARLSELRAAGVLRQIRCHEENEDGELLAYLLAGEKWKNGKHSISYRRSDKLVVEDENELLGWCKVSGRGFLKEPEMMLGDIKLALRRGDNIPFAHIEDQNNILIR